MSRVCAVSGTKSQRGKKIKLIWGVKYRSIRHREPNLRKTTVVVDGVPMQLKVSAKTLKSIRNGKIPGLSLPNYAEMAAHIESHSESSES